MLHTPALANAWFDLNQAVRYGTEIDGQSRELAVRPAIGRVSMG